MTFVEFCRAHGILLDHNPEFGVWKRYATEDKPKKRNGAVKYMGDHGFAQNWATDIAADVWMQDDRPVSPELRAKIERELSILRAEAQKKREREQAEAARKAEWIIKQARPSVHAYLALKGFNEERGLVWNCQDKDEATGEVVNNKLLIVPMRVDGRIVGCQMIDETGNKKFLKGQRTHGAVFAMDNRGREVLCEGFATALSVRAALEHLRIRYKLLVTFSAGNLARIAESLPDCFIVADRDAPTEQVPEPGGMGLKVALESKRPFWIADEEGIDFNDYARNVGMFKASQALRSAMR